MATTVKDAFVPGNVEYQHVNQPPRDKSDVDSALASLSRAAESVWQNCGILEERLRPMLRPSSPTGPDEAAQAPASCEFVERLDSETYRLRGLAEQLSTLLQRLAL